MGTFGLAQILFHMPINPTPELQQRLGRLEFLAHQAVEGFITGMHKSPFHGFSVEFAEHRLHNPGESTKHLDWKLYARTDKMFVKRYEEETNLRCQLVIDSSTSMAYPDGVTLDGDRMSKLKFAVLASAALIELFRRQRDAVGLSLFNEALDLQTPARSSRAHHRMLYDKLEGLLEASPNARKPRPSTPCTKSNPDGNDDQFIGLPDLLDLLTVYGQEFQNAIVAEDGESAIMEVGTMNWFECEYACENLPGFWKMSKSSDFPSLLALRPVIHNT